jgi:hypothetical protein
MAKDPALEAMFRELFDSPAMGGSRTPPLGGDLFAISSRKAAQANLGILPSGIASPKALAALGIRPSEVPGVVPAKGVASPGAMRGVARMGAMGLDPPFENIKGARSAMAAELSLLRELQAPGPERALTRIGGKVTPVSGWDNPEIKFDEMDGKGLRKDAKKWLKKLGKMRGVGPAGALLLLLGLGLGIAGGGSDVE